MKVKVFICTLAFLHIKEEILMKRKNYKVKVKLIFETTKKLFKDLINVCGVTCYFCI